MMATRVEKSGLSRHICRFSGQRFIDCSAQQFPVRRLGLIAQPFVVALSMGLWILHDGVSVLNADGVTEPPHRTGAAPEISKLPVAVQVDCTPNDVIVDVFLVNVGTDNESMIAFGKPPRHLHAEAVCLLRCDLPRHKGLPQVIRDHIIFSPCPARGRDILPLGQQELGVRSPAVTGIAGDKPSIIRLFRVFYISNDVPDGASHGSALSDVQRHDAGGGHNIPPTKKGGL